MRIFIKGVNWVGDALMATPAIEHLRRCHPEAHIALMVRPWVAAIYEHNPDISELIVVDDAAQFFKALRRVRQGGYQLGIALPNSVRSGLLLSLAGIQTRVGFRMGARNLFLNRLIPLRPELREMHQVYYYLELIKNVCSLPPPDVVRMKLIPGELEVEEMTRLLAGMGLDRGQTLVGIAPGAINSDAKRWLPERFAEVADWLTARNAEVLLLGSASEKEVVDRVAARARRPVHNLAAQVNLAQMVALTTRLRGLVCNDAGAMHIGAALGVPTVAIFGPTEWTTTYPFSPRAQIVRKEGVPCAPCMLRVCPLKGPDHHRCMGGVQVEMVTSAFEALMRNRKN